MANFITPPYQFMATVLLKYDLLLCGRKINGWVKCLPGENSQVFAYDTNILTNSYTIENLF